MKQKKKIFVKLILIILLLLSLSISVQATNLFDKVTVRETDVFTIQTLGASNANEEFRYTMNSDGTITITGYTGSSSILEIPSTYDGYVVSGIGDNAFKNNTSLVEVNIINEEHEHTDECYHYCDDDCYEYTPYYEECEICNGTGFIDDDITWHECSMGEECLDYGSGECNICQKIVQGSCKHDCYECDGIGEIEREEREYNCQYNGNNTLNCNLEEEMIGVKTIGEDAFYGCSNLESINIEGDNENYTSIDGVLFNKEQTILIKYPEGKIAEEYIIPDTVISIEENAFTRSSNISSIIIPEGVTVLNEAMFDGCNSLSSITISEDNEIYSSENGVLFNKNKTILIMYPVAKEDIEYTVPETVITIEEYSFENAINLNKVIIPNTVKNIKSNAFIGCANLENVVLEAIKHVHIDECYHNCNDTYDECYYTDKFECENCLGEGSYRCDAQAECGYWSSDGMCHHTCFGNPSHDFYQHYR